ncbi:MAG: energy transducer TonB [Verrucomicrobia bacterium]|nr:energy transducer TonB [Verrucomicrobiota bacterium]
MKRDLVVSAAIAAALHAGLLFGIRPGHAATRPAEAPPQGWVGDIIGQAPLPLASFLDDEPARWSGSRRPIFESYVPVVSPPDFEMVASRELSGGYFQPEPFVPVCPFFLETIAYTSHTAPLRVSDLDHVPLARMKARPAYPFAARRVGLSGEVVVEFEVDETGVVSSTQAVRSSDRVFVDSALRAVAEWKFEPGKKDGKPVRFRMALPIVFSLSGD